MRVDPLANTFGLPPCLRVPIAAADPEAVEEYVGHVVNRIVSRAGRVNALYVEPQERMDEDCRVPLWGEPNADFYRAQLHPVRQVWVHVDYHRYRMAYLRFGMTPLEAGYVLDHIQNREAMRLRDSSHLYLRLCPVSSAVNTSGGVNTGGEGLEKAYIRSLLARRGELDGPFAKFARKRVIYADPMDLTKMLDIAPGTQMLNGVRDTRQLLYPIIT